MAQKFRKKPIVIEAYQYHADQDHSTTTEYPRWLLEAITYDKVRFDGEHLIIDTLEGPLAVASGDWIIRGIKGELYPCKPDIFEATYEPVNEMPTQHLASE